MKTPQSILLLAAMATLLGSGCVSRTVSSAPGRSMNGSSKEDDAYGLNPKPKVVEKKIVWIWQKEYREGR